MLAKLLATFSKTPAIAVGFASEQYVTRFCRITVYHGKSLDTARAVGKRLAGGVLKGDFTVDGAPKFDERSTLYMQHHCPAELAIIQAHAAPQMKADAAVIEAKRLADKEAAKQAEELAETHNRTIFERRAAITAKTAATKAANKAKQTV